jgi:hypothetical protein
MGVQLRFHPDFNPAFHGGYLPASLVLPDDAGLLPLFEATLLRKLKVGFDLYFEWFDGSTDSSRNEELTQQEQQELAVRSSSFCAVFTLSVEDSPGCAVCAFFAAVGLARLSNGVMVDPEADNLWDPDQALRSARSFFTSAFPLNRCQATDRPFEAW